MSTKRSNILLKCRACGFVSIADVSHKLSSYILKNPPTPQEKQGPAQSNADKKVIRDLLRNEQKELEEQEDDEEHWAVPITQEAINQRRLALLGTKDRLSVVLDDDGDDSECNQKSDEKARKHSFYEYYIVICRLYAVSDRFSFPTQQEPTREQNQGWNQPDSYPQGLLGNSSQR